MPSRSNPALTNRKPFRLRLCLAAFAVLLGGSSATRGQTLGPPPPQPGSTPASPYPTDVNGTLKLPSTDQEQPAGISPAALPAAQIVSILQQRPEVMVELKSLLADQIQQRGGQVTADQISDDQLYSQISSNADLRIHITTFLRARGYVADDSTAAVPVNDSNVPANPDRSFLVGAAAAGLDDENTLAGPSGFGTRRINSPATTKRGRAEEHNPAPKVDTEEPQVLRRAAPYNLQSLRDLYTQLPQDSPQLKRFGSDLFLSRENEAIRDNSGRAAPMDVPLGPSYVVGVGDALTISLWGGVTQSITRTVDRDGRILLPEGGSQQVAGLPLEQVQSMVESVLKRQYRDVESSVTVSQLRSVRVYLTGDLQRPGGYDLGALATPLGALIAAGGPTATGSLRRLVHLRGGKIVEEIDLYDFLLNGLRAPSMHFESGDTLLVPPAGPQVAIFGGVKRPAIYELKEGKMSLDQLVRDAGGFTATALPASTIVERIDARGQRETLALPSGGGAVDSGPAGFAMRDGDRVRVAQVLPYSQRVIYLEGHVARPGRQAYTEGMALNNVLHSYADMLPEPAERGEIVRLIAPDLHAETIVFNIPDVLIGNQVIVLQPFDTIRIRGRYEADAPRVTINGEVLRAGSYPLSNGMSAADLVQMAGGFKRDALTEVADLTSYEVLSGNKVAGRVASVRIGAAVAGADRSADLPLKPGDVLTIHQITGWNDIGEAVTIEGQVAHPGSYGFVGGEHLSSILRRAGGFRESAYPSGAVLVREQVRELEEKSREELIRQIEGSSAAARVSPSLASGDSSQTLQLIQSQQDQVLARLKSQPASGRLVVHITADIDSWANTDIDIELRRGDTLTIPKRPGFVLVTGQVFNATALTFTPGKTAGWYLQNAGGATSTANHKEIFVIRANGSVVGHSTGGFLSGGVLSTRLEAGDVVVVPQKIFGGSMFWKNLLTTAQFASSIAITAFVAGL